MFNRKSTTVVIERPTTEEVNEMALYAPAPDTAMITVPEPVAPDATPLMEHTKAFTLRLLPVTWAWGGLSTIVWWFFPQLGVNGFLVFAALTALLFLLLYWLEYRHSQSGYQGKVLHSLVNLKKIEMKQEHQIRREALKATVKGGVVSSRDW